MMERSWCCSLRVSAVLHKPSSLCQTPSTELDWHVPSLDVSINFLANIRAVLLSERVVHRSPATIGSQD